MTMKNFEDCVNRGLFSVCQQIEPIPDGKLLLAYIRNVSFTSKRYQFFIIPVIWVHL